MAFRLLDNDPVYFGTNGLPCAGGTLNTYVTGTTTPLATYSDNALTVSNGSVVTLDNTGRAPVDLWGSETYRVVLKDVNGVTVWTKDNVTFSNGMPSLVTNGYIYSPDGLTLACASIRQVPDPTGSAGKTLTTPDGVNLAWGNPGMAAGAGGSVADWVTSNMRELRQNVTAAATTTLDYKLGGMVVLSQAVSITSLAFANLPAAGQTAIFTIRRVHDATTTTYTIAWPAGIKWPGGIAPTLTQTANARDTIAILTEDGGATWDASYNLALA